jgi:hypothetical protein
MSKPYRASIIIAVSALGLTLGGCGSDSKDDSGTEAVWGGADPHLTVTGTLGGETFDIDLHGADSTAANLACERQYEAPADTAGNPAPAQAVYVETVISVNVDLGDQPVLLEMQFKHHDMQSETVPATVHFIPRVDGQTVPADSTWFEVQWGTADGTTDLFEESAESGSFVLENFEGTPDSGNVITTGGTVGGLAQGSWGPDESLTVSFTAVCGDSSLDLAE